ncbi:hypothetical protein AB0H83_03080 [Dactylosporangium sp. NPDC050688]|uniref:hypothetical protein n=1 Tax=Dactylosporangium sp. NPDC050688 TaxID=3157217 RepID=UPI0033F31328
MASLIVDAVQVVAVVLPAFQTAPVLRSFTTMPKVPGCCLTNAAALASLLALLLFCGLPLVPGFAGLCDASAACVLAEGCPLAVVCAPAAVCAGLSLPHAASVVMVRRATSHRRTDIPETVMAGSNP